MMHDELDLQARVLICVLNQPADYALLQQEHWYRIPLARAPRQVAVSYLAFYLTKRFGNQRWSVREYATVAAVQILPRASLLPEQASHPRAAELYYCYRLGPLQELPQPIPSRRLRRVSFIPTTLHQLLEAHDLSDTWEQPQPDPGDLWGQGIGRRAVW